MSDRFDSTMKREELIETRKFAVTLAREFIDPRVKYPAPGEVLDAAKPDRGVPAAQARRVGQGRGRCQRRGHWPLK